jgi:hypothetical protein
MFEYFRNSIGVANVMDFKGRIKLPEFITRKKSGEGFVEAVERICSCPINTAPCQKAVGQA